MTPLRAPASLASLPSLRDHALSWAREAGLDIALEPKLDLVLEETLVNVANHAYGGEAGDVELECAVRDESFCCTVRDWGAPFNPLAEHEVDTESSVEDRAVGGLGLFFITTMSDSCSYLRNDEANELTFCFAL